MTKQHLSRCMGSQNDGIFESTMAADPYVESLYIISGDGCCLLAVHFSPGEPDHFCKKLLNYGRCKVNISIKQVKQVEADRWW
ncbi:MULTISPECIES: hypothetical protein [unclassified Sporolactobacillus]|uniref:hypothetical protein n=1 Tax=unclassified Sporolactobacillus TaxID=2628533 RepID=UPI002368AEC2|nr:hypothetical protein [Sporolactobacillus sp. CQH2019]MDD9149794.1 hypothetical protein [Sporolactobacillus sp. CQH2019]